METGVFLCQKAASALAGALCSGACGQTEMGFIDITARTLVFWTLLKGEVARLRVVVVKEEFYSPSNATQSLLFIFHFEWGKV